MGVNSHSNSTYALTAGSTLTVASTVTAELAALPELKYINSCSNSLHNINIALTFEWNLNQFLRYFIIFLSNTFRLFVKIIWSSLPTLSWQIQINVTCFQFNT